MLYNPTWKPERDIHSLDSLIKWLEGKNRFGWYRYTNSCDCLLAQYFTDMGVDGVRVGSSHYLGFYNGEWVNRDLPNGWDSCIAVPSGVIWGTFRGALKRAKALRAERRNTSSHTPQFVDHI
jgi:hypothetical protein